MPRDDLSQVATRALLSRLSEVPIPRPGFRPEAHQQMPDWNDPTWDTWLMLAGRGTGKTLAASWWMDRLLTEHRWEARIIAPTVRDARECVLGASGLKAINPSVQWRINEASVHWPNGSRARLYGAFTPEDVERLRAGTNSHLDWYEELAAWPRLDEVYQQASFGLRLGDHPRAIATTTPKPKDRLRRLVADPKTRLTRASTADNPHLADGVRARLYAEYAGTRLGAQELEGLLLDDVEGALWSSSMIDPQRVAAAPELGRRVVSIDPAKTRRRDSDLTGMIVVGRGPAPLDWGPQEMTRMLSMGLPASASHAYVLADLSDKYSPQGWAQKAIWAYHHFDCDYITCETNIAGDLVQAVIRAEDPNVPVRGFRSRQNKHGRALPAVGLYEQHRVHHVGHFPQLEDQMYAFTGSGESSEADDRVDALVLGLGELQLTRDVMVSRGWRAYA